MSLAEKPFSLLVIILPLISHVATVVCPCTQLPCDLGCLTGLSNLFKMGRMGYFKISDLKHEAMVNLKEHHE